MVNILFFAQVREILNSDGLSFELSEAVAVSQLIELLIKQDEAFGYLNEAHLFIAVNQEISERNALVNVNDEVAFFPAVTGG